MARLTIFYFAVHMTFALGGCTARSLEGAIENRPASAEPDRSSGRWKNLGTAAGLDGGGASLSMNLADVAPTLRREYAPGQIVSGRVEGLLGAGLVLQLITNDARDELHVLRAGPIAFPFPLARGAGYAATVAEQPTSPAQRCTISDGTGIVSEHPISDLLVSCATTAYTVGGTVTGLRGTIIVTNNDTDQLTLAADGAFVFHLPVKSGGDYRVRLLLQPEGQHCVVSDGANRIDSRAVENVTVSCRDATCVNLGWKRGGASWSCPNATRLPTASEYDKVAPCIDPGDVGRFSPYADVAVSVGGCGCGWNAAWCDAPSIETIRRGRQCGDYAQLHVCVAE